MDFGRVELLRQYLEAQRRVRQLAAYKRDAMFIRQLRDASNPFEMPEQKFGGKYRLGREVARRLVEELRPHMHARQRITGIPVHLKVLTALHFFGHGSDQKGLSADHWIPQSQPSVSQSLSMVLRALNTPAVMRTHIKVPDTAAAGRATIQRNSMRSNIPGVSGYVDGTHILIVAPSVHEEQYVNRKGTHSLNAQVTCDSDMVILNIFSRYPGSTNDSIMWAHSAMRRKMEELYRGGEQCWLLGDSGYPLEPWLLVPCQDAAAGSREANFTKAHMIDRSVVERTIGHLKNRFRCLHRHRVLEYSPVKAGMIVNACAVLHNVCARFHVPEPDSDNSDSDDDDPAPSKVMNGRARDRLLHEGQTVRQRVVARVPQLPPRQPFNPHRRVQ